MKLFLVYGLSLSAFAFTSCNTKASETYTVDFFNNYLREEFTLSNGTTGTGNNLIYKTVKVKANQKLAKPEDPEKKNYDFLGWFLETTCETPYDFNAEVTKNLKLYAQWTYSGKDNVVEPPYTPPSTVLEDSASTDFVVDSVMYSKNNYNSVKLTASAISKLEASKDNVLPLMEYRVKQGKPIAAYYEDSYIKVNCDGNTTNIKVNDDSINHTLSNASYETKAKKYEANATSEESYHVMLAGSSSIEFWETSKEDMDPIVSYNHGIGGTTIEQWSEHLNQRLVLPYKPKMVVYYVGINNVINSKQTAGTIKDNLTAFFDKTHADLPDTKVQYILMNLLPGYPTYADTIKEVNDFARSYQSSHSSWLTLINPGEALLKGNGEPNAAYFRTDGLHLSYYGYIIWGGIIKQSIVNGLQKM